MTIYAEEITSMDKLSVYLVVPRSIICNVAQNLELPRKNIAAPWCSHKELLDAAFKDPIGNGAYEGEHGEGGDA